VVMFASRSRAQLLALATVCLVSSVVPGKALASARISAGTIDLDLYVSYPASEPVVEGFSRCVRDANAIVFESTRGQLRIGRATISNEPREPPWRGARRHATVSPRV